MDLKPDPVKILDIAEIVRSPTEKDLGPWFYVDARQTPIFIEVSLTNYVSFLCVCPVIDHEFRHNIVKVAVDPQTTWTML